MPLIQQHTKPKQAEQKASVSKSREISLQVYLNHFLPIVFHLDTTLLSALWTARIPLLILFMTQFFLSSLRSSFLQV